MEGGAADTCNCSAPSVALHIQYTYVYLIVMVHRHFASSVPLTLISSKAQEFARGGFRASDRLVSSEPLIKGWEG